MRRFTHWLFALTPLPRTLALLVLFLALGGGLLLSLSTTHPAPINKVQTPTCSTSPPSVDPSSACATPSTYQDFRYVCGNGSEGYLGTDASACLTLEEATARIATYCAAACP